MTGWVEVGLGVFHRRYEPWDVSVCVVRGDDGLLLVDTRASPGQARELARDLRPFGAPVRWVVNTHAHFDHVFGNSVFSRSRTAPGERVRPAASDDGATVVRSALVIGHRALPAHLGAYERPLLEQWLQDPSSAPVEGLDEVRLDPPDLPVADSAVLDVGGRQVALHHLGRGHTDNDLLVHVPDADTWLVGDLVEESGPPAYGSGSFPLEWPATAGRLETLLTGASVVVPGHGAPVDRKFVVDQRADLRRVELVIRELHAAGVPVTEAVSAGGSRWPFPVATITDAVADGYRHLRTPAAQDTGTMSC